VTERLESHCGYCVLDAILGVAGGRVLDRVWGCSSFLRGCSPQKCASGTGLLDERQPALPKDLMTVTK
jgi:hypothetical protein